MEDYSQADSPLGALVARYKEHKSAFLIGSLFVVLFLFYFLVLSAPGDFPSGTIFKVKPGMSLHGTAFKLKEAHFIRSRLAFEAFVIIFGREKSIISSDYYFEDKLPVFEVARRISKGEHHIAPVLVTIPEGFDNAQIADTFAVKLANFKKDNFLLKTKNLQGHLFPDTYFFLTTAEEDDVILSMSDNFKKKITPLLPEITKKNKTEDEIVTMASLIEKEAKGGLDRGFISGILWKRLSIGMLLEVDAAPETYKEKGLPKSPVGNPGLESLRAALYPQSSPYLYYLHDKNGDIHYAKTFAEHLQNELKYLK